MHRFLQRVLSVAPEGVEESVVSDEAVITYLEAAAGVGGDDSSEEAMDVESFMDVLMGFVPGLELPAEQHEIIGVWYKELTDGTQDREGSAGSSATPRIEAPTVPSVPASLSGLRNSEPSSETRQQTSKSGKQASPPSSSQSQAKQHEPKKTEKCPNLEQLLAVCPDVSKDALRYVLKHHCGNRVEAAAMYVLDSGIENIESQYQAYKDAREKALAQQQIREEQDAEAVKKTLMARYDEYSVNAQPKAASVPQSKVKKAQRRMARLEKKERDKGLTRYLDGQVVSRKGERFTVLDDGKTEWNGGSKGKVITKGKRGPGFVSG